jgi:hypothetical protein
MGLLGDVERKSVEPIAARACPDPQKVDAMHQRLLHFAVDSKWSNQEVRRQAAQYALESLVERKPVEAWIVDDTGFLKQGSHSVGVQRQYTGSAGKIANCQVGVSLATRTEHLPIDFELYLPTDWANSPERRKEARIPPEVTFKTKPQLALGMIRRAMKQGEFFWEYLSPGWAVAFLDSWCSRVLRSRIEPMKKVARTLQAHRSLLLNWFRAKGELSSGADEGMNKLKVVTRRAYGFRTC